MARKKKVGRPKEEFDPELFEELCGLQCTLVEIATVMGISRSTVQRRVREHYGLNFDLVFNKYREGVKISLRRWMFEKAKKGNVPMQIWLSKQYLGHRDKPADLGESVAQVAGSVMGAARTMKAVEDE